MLESNQRLAVIDRGLDLRANPAWCAVAALPASVGRWLRNGSVAANITAKEVVIMGKVQGNVDCADRLDIRSEGQLTGDVITHRISVEEGAILKGGVEVRNPEKKDQKTQVQVQAQNKPEPPKAMAAAAGNA